MKTAFTILSILPCLVEVVFAAEPFDPVAAGELPQYILFNKAATANDPLAWHQGQPRTFSIASMQELRDKFGTTGNSRIRLGLAFSFSVLESDPKDLAKSLETLLTTAQQADVPVFICLDGQNWWTRRPDLWNWWDKTLPGYNPANRMNVEWTDWGPEHAIKISWRNWGRQIRIPPAQNIFAPRVIREVEKGMNATLPILVRWHKALPPDRKYLFAGLKIGWETSINTNAYYHKNGNRIFDANPTDASKDPTELDPAKGFAFGAAILGYAAATSAGLKKSGELTIGDHETLVHKYLAHFTAIARNRGIPAHLIFTHQGGTYAPWDKHLSFKPAIIDDSVPGWSFYSHDPQDSGSLAKDMESAGRRQWGAVEWWRGAADEAGWKQRFERTLGFKQCRLISVYNWEPFKDTVPAVAAVKALTADPPEKSEK